jgi:DNA topoisomerase VI subunit A
MRLATKEAIIESIRKSTREGKPTKKAYVLEFLLEQKQDAEDNPEIKTTGTMTLDDVWYHLRKYKFIPNGIEITEDTRRSVKAYIAELCDLLGFRREQLGIIAQPFGTLYFRGDSWDITIDQLESLKYLGAYVVIIEKEGIVQSLKPFADKYGIALLSSHGFLTENAADLSNLIKGVEGNVAILTDYDISGLLIALNIHGIHRIGIDLETLRNQIITHLSVILIWPIISNYDPTLRRYTAHKTEDDYDRSRICVSKFD